MNINLDGPLAWMILLVIKLSNFNKLILFVIVFYKKSKLYKIITQRICFKFSFKNNDTRYGTYDYITLENYSMTSLIILENFKENSFKYFLLSLKESHK